MKPIQKLLRACLAKKTKRHPELDSGSQNLAIPDQARNDKKKVLTRQLVIIASIFIFSFAGKVYAEIQIPQPVGYVNDFADVISPENEDKINSIAQELKDKSTAEVVVVTLKSLDGYPIEDWALKIGRDWKVGAKGKDNGVVIVVAPNDRKTRIEVGYGVEGFLTDAQTGRIRDNYMIPYFKQGDYEKGIVLGTASVVSSIAKGYGVEISGNYTVRSSNMPSSRQGNPLTNLIFLGLLLAFAIKYPRAALFLLLTMGSGGRGGNSDSGCGFGGFSGGGGFGGGGSSGSW